MNIDPKEKEKFNKIAEEWWDPSGKFAPLHKINPLRANYIAERTELKNKQILDVACGGGLLAEALSHLKEVTYLELIYRMLPFIPLKIMPTKRILTSTIFWEKRKIYFLKKMNILML